ncbi:YtxH domain-containing protein [Blattabacterium cuenoti]|uniref:YtxH domain-containing protein n=1 Tax=Blattabacterium cuenoti TaxID=1653831 RepID=UPI00163B8D77|nr:YtxH domain-containing protein [Blattabacterium cuenoti]
MKKNGNFIFGVIFGSLAVLILSKFFSSKSKEDKMINMFGETTEKIKENFKELVKKFGKIVKEMKYNFEHNKCCSKKNKTDKIDQVEEELGT